MRICELIKQKYCKSTAQQMVNQINQRKKIITIKNQHHHQHQRQKQQIMMIIVRMKARAISKVVMEQKHHI